MFYCRPNGATPCDNRYESLFPTLGIGDSSEDFEKETGTNTTVGIDGSSSYTFIGACSESNTALYIQSSGVTVSNVIIGLDLQFR